MSLFYLIFHVWIRIRILNTDPQSSWKRIQYGSGSTTLVCTVLMCRLQQSHTNNILHHFIIIVHCTVQYTCVYDRINNFCFKLRIHLKSSDPWRVLLFSLSLRHLPTQKHHKSEMHQHKAKVKLDEKIKILGGRLCFVNGFFEGAKF